MARYCLLLLIPMNLLLVLGHVTVLVPGQSVTCNNTSPKGSEQMPGLPRVSLCHIDRIASISQHRPVRLEETGRQSLSYSLSNLTILQQPEYFRYLLMLPAVYTLVLQAIFFQKKNCIYLQWSLIPLHICVSTLNVSLSES